MSRLDDWLTNDKDAKRFEVVAKHYYDLFAYHAAQRLTTFNFFIVSFSFLSNAYVDLIDSGRTSISHFYAAFSLGFVAYLLCITFGRLDKRNEQIISINEQPLMAIQEAIQKQMPVDLPAGPNDWQTFKRSTDEARVGRTFGHLLPLIYWLASGLAAFGAIFALLSANVIVHGVVSAMLLLSVILSAWAINVKGPMIRQPLADWLAGL